jgi:hypothetical protein
MSLDSSVMLRRWGHSMRTFGSECGRNNLEKRSHFDILGAKFTIL